MGTKNLTRRPIEQRDLSLFVSWVNHNTAFSLMLDLRTPTTLNDMTEWFEESRSDWYKDFIFEKNGEARAFGSLSAIDLERKTAQIRIFVYPSLMNLGISVEVVKSLCFYCFMELELDEIYTLVNISDYTATCAYTECGFYTDGPIPENYCGSVFYMLRKSDWEEDYYPS